MKIRSFGIAASMVLLGVVPANAEIAHMHLALGATLDLNACPVARGGYPAGCTTTANISALNPISGAYSAGRYTPPEECVHAAKSVLFTSWGHCAIAAPTLAPGAFGARAASPPSPLTGGACRSFKVTADPSVAGSDAWWLAGSLNFRLHTIEVTLAQYEHDVTDRWLATVRLDGERTDAEFFKRASFELIGVATAPGNCGAGEPAPTVTLAVGGLGFLE